ncbi:MAG TPA: hypothetical protein VGD57_07820, partial [Candidatus Dormibacteraeota bacterium]
RGDCRLCIDHIAAIAGVARSTVKNAVRQARTLGLVTVEERAQTAWRNLSNVVRIVSSEWQAWNRLARRPSLQGGGVKSVTSTNTQGLELRGKRPAEASKKLPERQGHRQLDRLWSRRGMQDGLDALTAMPKRPRR